MTRDGNRRSAWRSLISTGMWVLRARAETGLRSDTGDSARSESGGQGFSKCVRSMDREASAAKGMYGMERSRADRATKGSCLSLQASGPLSLLLVLLHEPVEQSLLSVRLPVLARR